MKAPSKIREEGQDSRGLKVRVVEGNSKEKLFLPDPLQLLYERFGMEGTSPAWTNVYINRPGDPK